METATWRRLGLRASAGLLLLVGLSCKDSVTTALGGAAASRVNGPGDPNMALTAATAEICGVIPATLVITENTRLACDVECTNATGPCIQFGRDNVTLWLNGFKMTGPASPPTSCGTGAAPDDGISTAGFDRVRIRGPGMVQQFRRHGILLSRTDGAIVERVTSHYNCFSGLQVSFSNENEIVENVSVRNASASGVLPCGGNCISNSNGNRIWRNHFYGNGSVAVAPPFGANDFGVGLVGTSSDNVIESNSIGGNINGIFVFPLATRNLIRRNVFAGNPPVQLSATAGTPVGVDIRNTSPAGANTFVENHCITSEGPVTPDPCPNFPTFRGHY